MVGAVRDHHLLFPTVVPSPTLASSTVSTGFAWKDTAWSAGWGREGTSSTLGLCSEGSLPTPSASDLRRRGSVSFPFPFLSSLDEDLGNVGAGLFHLSQELLAFGFNLADPSPSLCALSCVASPISFDSTSAIGISIGLDTDGPAIGSSCSS